jgi:hypothetical protein
MKTTILRGYSGTISVASKIFAIVFPGFLLGIVHTPAIVNDFLSFLLLCNILRKFILFGEFTSQKTHNPTSTARSHELTIAKKSVSPW